MQNTLTTIFFSDNENLICCWNIIVNTQVQVPVVNTALLPFLDKLLT